MRGRLVEREILLRFCREGNFVEREILSRASLKNPKRKQKSIQKN
jgi:hypothetical protein